MQDFKDYHATSLADAIKRTPGVYFQEFDGNNFTRVYIRGYDSQQIGYYIDGIPMNEIFDGGTNDYDFFHTQSFSNVQISKGFASPIYGTNILGGAINMVSAKPQKELEISMFMKNLYGRHGGVSPFETQQGIAIGTNQGKYYIQAEVSRVDRQSYPLPGSYSGTAEASIGIKSGVMYENTWARFTLGWRPNENHEYSFNYILQRASKGSYSSSIASNPKADNEYGRWSYPDKNKNVFYLLGKTFFTPNLSLNSRLYYQTYYDNMIWFSGPSIYDDWGLGGIFDLSWDIAEKTNLKVGLNEKYDSHIGIYEYSPGVKWQYADIVELKSSIFAQFAQGVGPLRFVAAGSYDRVDPLKLWYESQFSAGKTEMTKKRLYESIGDWTLQGVIYYDFAENNTAHITVGKKQTWPSIRSRFTTDEDQILNTDLKAESAINYEVGYDLRLKSFLGSTFVSAAAYFNDMKNMLSSETYTYATAAEAECAVPYHYTNAAGTINEYRCYKLINVDEGYTYGGEIAVEQGFFDDKLVLGVNYSYIQKYALNSSSDNTSAGHKKIRDYANHQLNGKVAVRPLKDLDIVALWTYHSAPYYSTYRTVGGQREYFYYKGKPYVIVDLSVGYHIAKGFSVNLAAYNLLDRMNYLNSSQTAYYVQPGRRVVVGLEYKY